MDNYIVRIYRRQKDNPRVLVGLVEEVGTTGKKAFNDIDDLWEILNSVNARPERSKGTSGVYNEDNGEEKKGKKSQIT
ncbi:MAG TPA: hypothetical protein DCP92_03710 [Nitrospiraceae bacterium]|jgi:hypothetical protein|nr:hypothetical protein [Nitrospiraceae bacterium]